MMANAVWNCNSAERAVAREGKRTIMIEDKDSDKYIVIDYDEVGELINQLTALKFEWRSVYRP
jgi:hypothetical protein